MDKLTYAQAGVDTEKAAGAIARFREFLAGRPRDPKLLTGIGPFAACYDLKALLADYTDPLLVTGCDGVGTKALLALQWGKLDGLGEDLVAMSVNDLLCVGALPFQFLDYYACGKLSEEQMLPLLKSIQIGCEKAGCTLAGGETAEMPGVYKDEDFDLAGFCIGVVEREKVLGPQKVKAGDRLVGIPSSGLHSNGYSLVRKILEKAAIDGEGTSPFGAKWKDVILEPTRIYVSDLKDHLGELNGLAHITGGGLYENLPRMLPDGTGARVKWAVPPLFQWLEDQAGLERKELLSTFNCGMGLIAAVPGDKVSRLISEIPGSRDIGFVTEEPGIQWA